MKQLAVWLFDHRVGMLTQDKSGRMSFAYADGAKEALSLSMPLREQPYEHDLCESFFGGLLPESAQARKLIGRCFGVNGNNNFSLLGVIGHECAGAISIYPDGIEPPAIAQSAVVVLSERALAEHIRELPRRPLLAGIEGIRLSLAGAGDKAAVSLIDGNIALASSGAVTSHILKTNISTIGETVSNEFFCMKLAERMGFAVAEVELRMAEDIEFLLVRRYDRDYDQNGNPVRLHQEDFCQALGVISANKYESEGGPGYRDCFELLRRVSRPAVDRNRFVEYTMLNFLIGNMDAHGKNFSLLHGSNLSLAPLYDVLSTRIYPQLSPRLAMRVDKYYEPDRILPRHWKRLCEACGLSYPAFKRTFTDFCDEIVGRAECLRDDFRRVGHQQTYTSIVEQIEKSAKFVGMRFREGA